MISIAVPLLVCLVWASSRSPWACSSRSARSRGDNLAFALGTFE